MATDVPCDAAHVHYCHTLPVIYVITCTMLIMFSKIINMLFLQAVNGILEDSKWLLLYVYFVAWLIEDHNRVVAHH